MKNNIIKVDEIYNYSKYLGSKTLNLKKGLEWGFNVPELIALPTYISRDLFKDDTFREKVVKDVIKTFSKNRYVVRSSALIEDGKNQSYAGQFLTKINLKSNELNSGIFEVLKQADSFLRGNLDNFSIIIQEYIIPDISGVTFTRNPDGNREMVIEYGFCDGEKIVGGEITPTKISLYWNDRVMNLPKVFLSNNLIDKFKWLELKNNAPQDIEWCIKDGVFYCLQMRPITTITQNQYKEIVFLEGILSKDKKYFYEKTEISEIAPRPTNFTYDLLNLIYSDNGPVFNVYKKHKVVYKNSDFLKIIGNELFIDREAEIRGIMPVCSYLRKNDFSPSFFGFFGICLTLKNIFYLNKINTSRYDSLFYELKKKIELKNQSSLNIKEGLELFLRDYELIFEINLLAGLSTKKAEFLLKKEAVNFIKVLNNYSYFTDLKKYQINVAENLIGNSLDFLDESFLVVNKIAENYKISDEVIGWWKKMSKYKKDLIGQSLAEAIIYNRLRELGRWLTIKNINILRDLLLSHARDKNFIDLKNIFFANIENVLNDKIDEALCSRDKNKYADFNNFSLPNQLKSSFVVNEVQKVSGVSHGVANGFLQNRKFVQDMNGNCEKVILYVDFLSPDLTAYFDKIAGIISRSGGLLSHLAIIAREAGIPVVVGFSLKGNDVVFGDYLQIDGSSGMVNKAKIKIK